MRNLFLKAAVKFTCPCARPSVENAPTPLKRSTKHGLLLTSKNSILCGFFLIQSDYLAYFSISKIQKLPNTPKGFPRINLPSCCCQEQVLALPKFRLEGGGRLTMQAVLTSLRWSNSGNPSRTPLWSNSGKEKFIGEKSRLICLPLFLPQALLILSSLFLRG